MQYTANKPYNSVLIIQPSGLRYRLHDDHVFKEIRYAQVTGVKIKKDLFRLYFIYLLLPLALIGQLFLIQEEGLSFINGLNFFFWCIALGLYFFNKQAYTLTILKGSLAAEVYLTYELKEARKIKKEIESRL